MTNSTPTLTLTESGLLDVLLKRQRYKVIELARHRAHREHVRAAFWDILTWPRRARTAPAIIEDSNEHFVRTFPRQA